ncbi:hypothetical protein HOLleu_04229 [Holothuria leucospilota]|uniref:Uncharacterized protein n=1 Tax=Holothuria leucospilota TaxID=206669 RepID=A0A9Q1CRR7_HOLLE|nr:hypothetical protein HOLleu_04229 [Holothuria leucospilota]
MTVQRSTGVHGGIKISGVVMICVGTVVPLQMVHLVLVPKPILSAPMLTSMVTTTRTTGEMSTMKA